MQGQTQRPLWRRAVTTVAATLRRMAADSRVVTDHSTFPSSKLLRTKRGIVGGAGCTDLINSVLDWLDGKGRKPRIPARRYDDFRALILDDRGLWYMESDLVPMQVHDGLFAIGTGAQFALGSMERDISLDLEPDPIAAVKAACMRDEMSAEPISFLTLGR